MLISTLESYANDDYAQAQVSRSSFGANVRRLMADRGLTQSDLIRLLHVKQGTLSDWLRDRRGIPEGPTLIKFAKTFGVSVDVLLRGVDDDYDAIVIADGRSLENEALEIATAWPHVTKDLRVDLKRMILRHARSAVDEASAADEEDHLDLHARAQGTSRRRPRTTR